MTSFASDNTAGAHPAVVAAVTAAASGHAPSYGEDAWTAEAHAALRAVFGDEAEPFLVTTGTAANVLALDALTRPHHGVVCPQTAHLVVDECGAPTRFSGVTLLPVETSHGRLTPQDVRARVAAAGVGDEHRVQPRVVSISQATEHGTVYTPDEIRALADVARHAGMFLHLDGARLANAAAALDVPVRALTTDAGVDVVTVGLTKCGGMLAEAVVFLRPGLADDFSYLRKQGTQLVSKMRFIAAQVGALLAGGLWLELAGHANEMATRLAASVEDVAEIAHPVETNAVFVAVDDRSLPAFERVGALHPWSDGVVRWMTAWDTTEAEVDAFAAAVRKALAT